MNRDDLIAAFESGFKESVARESDKTKEEFVRTFPYESLADMSLADYALGVEGNSYTFCCWLEYGTAALGSIEC